MKTEQEVKDEAKKLIEQLKKAEKDTQADKILTQRIIALFWVLEKRIDKRKKKPMETLTLSDTMLRVMEALY